MSPSCAMKKAWANPRTRARIMSGGGAASGRLYFKRYPWLPAARHDEMRALVKKVGRASAEAAMRVSVG